MTYTAGDPLLLSSDPDYAKSLPYRVTLLSIGTAADPSHPTQAATHQIQAVLALAPRKLSNEPTDWATMQGYTVYQTKEWEDIFLEIPCRVEGPIRVQKKLKIADDYPEDYDARRRYLGDLNAMRLAGLPDYRPVSGPVTWNSPIQDQKHKDALIWLGVTSSNKLAQTVAADWTKPTSLVGYRLYPGGPTYAIPSVGATLANISLGPDPQTNPLGIFYCGGTVTLGANVTLRGSLLCSGDILVTGVNLDIQPVDAPSLYGSTAPVHLPTVSCENFAGQADRRRQRGGCGGGLRPVRGRGRPGHHAFAVTGRVITNKLYLRERQPWDWLDWQNYYQWYLFWLYDLSHYTTPYFPVWMQDQDCNPVPLVTIKPDPSASPILYHWHNWYDPVYVRHPDDAGLRWDLVRWTENP